MGEPWTVVNGKAGGIVKITDFGIAHAADNAPVTLSGQLVGTPGFLAPERAVGAQATAASDLYSLGTVAYECLVGAPPFSGLAVAVAHHERALPPLPGQVPAEAAALVLELAAKDPAARPHRRPWPGPGQTAPITRAA